MAQKNTKPQIYRNPFEQVAEIGQRIPQHVAQQVLDTFNPLSALDAKAPIDTVALKREEEKVRKEKKAKGEDFTPLDMQMLEEKYRKQDEYKAQQLKRRLFDLVKKGEEEAIEARHKEEEEKKKAEAEEEEQKRKEEEEQKAATEQDNIPQGKEARGGLFAKKPKKQIQMENAPERKAAKSKQ